MIFSTFLGIINNVRWWLEIVQTMFGCFMVRGKKGGMKHVMNPLCFREIKVISHM